MHLQVITVGNKMPDWINKGVDEYIHRFIHPFHLTLKTIAAAKRKTHSTTEIKKYQQQEAAAITKLLKPRNPWIALEVTGKMISTEVLAQKLNHYAQKTSELSFVIGSADGLDKTLLQNAGEQWSLSPLTLPHPLVRIIVIEQLYRATTILKNHPYHRS